MSARSRALGIVMSAGLVAGLGLVGPSGAGAAARPAGRTTADAPPGTTAYEEVELQARTNLLVNDEGWNLPPGSSFNSITPAINDAADVTFRVQLATLDGDPTSNTAGLWAGGHGEGSIVFRPADAEAPIDNDPTINEAGDIAFTISDGGVGNRLWRYDGAAGTAAQVTTNPVVPNSYGSPGIDEDSDIGFQASYSSGREFAAVVGTAGDSYVQDAGLDSASPYGFLYTPAYNDEKVIAGKVGLTADISNKVQIRTFTADGSSTLLASSTAQDPASAYDRFDNSLGLSDNGIVAVVARRAADGARVVLRIDGTDVDEVAAVGSDGLTVIDSFPADVNDDGTVVFRGSDAGGQAIFVADGTTLTRVIGNGDPVDTDQGPGQIGQHDASPVFGGAPKINAGGDIVFTAALHPAGDNQTEWGTGVFVAYAGPSDDPDHPEVRRVSGTNRYGTAAKTATDAFDSGVPVAYVATGAGFPDALAAAALAGSQDGPVLLTQVDSLPPETAVALRALAPERIVVVGGQGSVSTAVAIELGGFTDGAVTRISGGNRFDTAAHLAEEFDAPTTVYVATGMNYPDALAGAARAGAVDAPMLLVRPDRIPDETKAALASLDPEQIVVLGGEASVSTTVMTQLEAYAPGAVERVAGGNRFETAALLADQLDSADTAYVATGRDWPDALAGGAAAAAQDAPVLLVEKTSVPDVTLASLDALEPALIRVLGGQSTVDDVVLEALRALDYTD